MDDRPRPIAALLSFAAGVLLLASSSGLGMPRGPAGLAFAGFVSAAVLAAFACAGALATRTGFVDALGLGPPRPGVGGPRIAVYAAGAIGASQILDLALRALDVRQTSALEMIDRSLSGTEPALLPLVLAGIALAPGFAEELLFRGLLLRSFVPRIGAAAAVVLTSLAFGALHLDPAQGTAAAILGVYLAIVTLASGSLWPAVVCHVANNALGVLLAASGVGSGWDGPIIWGAGAGLAAIGIRAASHDLATAASTQRP